MYGKIINVVGKEILIQSKLNRYRKEECDGKVIDKAFIYLWYDLTYL